MFKAIYSLFSSAVVSVWNGVKEMFDGETTVETSMTMEATLKVVSVFVFAVACASYFLPVLRPWTNSLMQVGMNLWNHNTEGGTYALDARQA